MDDTTTRRTDRTCCIYDRGKTLSSNYEIGVILYRKRVRSNHAHRRRVGGCDRMIGQIFTILLGLFIIIISGFIILTHPGINGWYGMIGVCCSLVLIIFSGDDLE